MLSPERIVPSLARTEPSLARTVPSLACTVPSHAGTVAKPSQGLLISIELQKIMFSLFSSHVLDIFSKLLCSSFSLVRTTLVLHVPRSSVFPREPRKS